MFACENGHEHAVKFLLDYSGSQLIDCNHQFSEKRTALIQAMRVTSWGCITVFENHKIMSHSNRNLFYTR